MLWLAPDNGGLVRYADGRFSRVTTADGLVDDHPRALLRGRHGDLWIGTVAGLSRLQDGRFTTVAGGQSLPAAFVTALAEDDEDGLWIGTIGGLARLHGDRITIFTERDGVPPGAIQRAVVGSGRSAVDRQRSRPRALGRRPIHRGCA